MPEQLSPLKSSDIGVTETLPAIQEIRNKIEKLSSLEPLTEEALENLITEQCDAFDQLVRNGEYESLSAQKRKMLEDVIALDPAYQVGGLATPENLQMLRHMKAMTPTVLKLSDDMHMPVNGPMVQELPLIMLEQDILSSVAEASKDHKDHLDEQLLAPEIMTMHQLLQESDFEMTQKSGIRIQIIGMIFHQLAAIPGLCSNQSQKAMARVIDDLGSRAAFESSVLQKSLEKDIANLEQAQVKYARLHAKLSGIFGQYEVGASISEKELLDALVKAQSVLTEAGSSEESIEHFRKRVTARVSYLDLIKDLSESVATECKEDLDHIASNPGIYTNDPDRLLGVVGGIKDHDVSERESSGLDKRADTLNAEAIMEEVSAALSSLLVSNKMELGMFHLRMALSSPTQLYKSLLVTFNGYQESLVNQSTQSLYLSSDALEGALNPVSASDVLSSMLAKMPSDEALCDDYALANHMKLFALTLYQLEAMSPEAAKERAAQLKPIIEGLSEEGVEDQKAGLLSLKEAVQSEIVVLKETATVDAVTGSRKGAEEPEMSTANVGGGAAKP